MGQCRSLWAVMTSVAVVAAQLGEMDLVIGARDLEGISPRFMLGSPPRIAKRADLTECDIGFSPCYVVNGTKGACCPNDNYCYVNPKGAVKCCSEGSRCDDPCPLESYRCTRSETTTCCKRACAAPSGFQCAQSLGGSCCSVGSICLEDNSCSPTVNPSTRNTIDSSASATGCSNNQFSCPASEGGGCCAHGQTCTSISTALACVGAPITSGPLASATGVTVTAPSTSQGGLSRGARAGVGVGVALVCIALLASLVLFIRSRRRLRRSTARDSSESSQNLGIGADTSRGSPGPSAGGGMVMVSTQPDARPGRFTHSEAADASGMTVAFTAAGDRGAVPLSPHSPGDITTPVEIAASEGRRSPTRTVASVTTPGSIQATPLSHRAPSDMHADGYFPSAASARDNTYHIELP